jgi:hypothetical protein
MLLLFVDYAPQVNLDQKQLRAHNSASSLMHALLTVKNVVGVLLVLFPSLGFFMVLSFGLCSYKQNEPSRVARLFK